MDMRNLHNSLEKEDARDSNSDWPPEMECKCGAGNCKVLRSGTAKNPNRLFYKCQQCGYFQWCDQLGQVSRSPIKPIQNNSPKGPINQGYNKSPIKINSSINTPLNSDRPICFCKAGKCMVLAMPNGEHKGRMYYACAIKKGQGACDHFVWVDNKTKEIEVDNNNNNMETRYPNQNSSPFESVQELFSENDMKTIDSWCNYRNAPDINVTGEMEGNKETSPVKRINMNDSSPVEETKQKSSPFESVKDLFSENDMNELEFWCNYQTAPDMLATGEMEGNKESSPVKRAHMPEITSPVKRLNLNGGDVSKSREISISPTVGTNLQNLNPAVKGKKCFKCW